jgi:hypothetical protein
MTRITPAPFHRWALAPFEYKQAPERGAALMLPQADQLRRRKCGSEPPFSPVRLFPGSGPCDRKIRQKPPKIKGLLRASYYADEIVRDNRLA